MMQAWWREKPILAKWRNQEGSPNQWGEPIGFHLIDHTKSVLTWASFFLGKGTETEPTVGRSIYDIMHLQDFVPYAKFRHLVITSCLLHDIGKANDEFQRMLWTMEATWEDCVRKGYDTKQTSKILKGNRYKQNFRHELAGLCYLTRNAPYDWLGRQVGEDYRQDILAAVYGHHLKTGKQVNKQVLDMLVDVPVFLPASEHGACEIIRAMSNEFQLDLEPFPVCPPFRKDLETVKARIDPIINDKQPETRLSYGIKVMTILADSFGSMCPEKGWKNCGYQGFTEWLMAGVTEALRPRQVHLLRHIGASARKHPYPHQEQALAITGDVLIDVAPGGGKSATGFMAAADQPKYISSQRVLLTENVRMAAFQLFRDLGTTKAGSSRRNTECRFSTAEIDKVLLGMSGDAFLPEGETDIAPDDILDIRYMLNQYSADVSYTTVDQVLGAIAYRRKAIMWLPLILRSIIIFDEFHSYDQTMRENFRAFLTFFPGIRAIAMSGTITPDQEQEFQALRPNVGIIRSSGGSEDLSRYQRYRFHELSSMEEALGYFSAEHRTLWVVNRVKVAQGIGGISPDALVLHSRYRHRERILLGENFVKTFRNKRLPVRAVATQIAQSSLDISGNRGIFEVCPLDEFVQRLGRTGERGNVPTRLTDIYFYRPETELPYSEDFDTLMPWYKDLTKRPSWSFHDLVECFKGTGAVDTHKEGTRLKMHSRPLLVRGATGKMTFLMEQDLPEIQERLKAGEPPRIVQEYELTDFIRADWENQDTFYGRVVLPGYNYDLRLGALK